MKIQKNRMNNKQTFFFGDVHGEYKKLIDVFNKANPKKGDRIISAGDLVDRGPDSYKVIQFCLDLEKDYEMIFIRGNHDACFRDSVMTGHSNMLYGQGGRETMLSYTRETECQGDPCKIPREHIDFFMNKQVNYFIDEENNLFVHGGFNRHEPLEEQHEDVFLWDRDFFMSAMSYGQMKEEKGPFKMKGDFKHVYVGHTPTMYWNETTIPITVANITNCDTGCGKGKEYPLSMLNIHTKELFQSSI